MSDYVIKVENLGKSYQIRHKQERYTALRDVLADGAKNAGRTLLGRNQGRAPETREEFWALNDVSFEVKQGERLGIIGRNGAGKSTLLKVLSRITQPTRGEVRLRGRVASLLEVGTGFHPELTGRENIYLNGAILGMTREEIRRKFDEIVAFAEVEKFLDTPVKRYSSGMYVRLAFAVAAHLEPEILIVDEVLAVGDASFQKKSVSRMEAAGQGGRTVVFVSHQMNQIRRLCDTVIWLDEGQVRAIGSTPQIVGAYETSYSKLPDNELDQDTFFGAKAKFLSWEIVGSNGHPSHDLTTLEATTIRFTLRTFDTVENGLQGIALYNSDNELLWGTAIHGITLHAGIHQIDYEMEILPLVPGPYHWLTSLYEGNQLIDLWNGMPEMLVSTAPLSQAREDWAGVLNLRYQVSIRNCK